MIYVVQVTGYEELLELLDTLPQTVVILGHMIQSLLSNKISISSLL